jgi:3-hydroxyacyl-CoA dehydrogenase
MFWADSLGLKAVRDRLLDFQRQHGEVWKPSALLDRLANEGKGFIG